MRKLIVASLVSLDGAFSGPDDNFMAMPLDQHFDTFCVERLRTASTLLLGANTYVGFSGFWPPVASDPDATPEQREISKLNGSMDKVVVSDTLDPDPTNPWHDTTRIVRRADANAQVDALKQEEGRDILMFGSRQVWSDLLTARLVDEIHLMLGAGIVGGGIPAFGDVPATSLRLLGTRTWADGSNVVLSYAVD